MPTDDPRLEQALHDAAPPVATTDVLDQIARRRTRRRRTRRVTTIALALVAALLVGTVALLATADDGSAPHVAAPPSRLEARVVADGVVIGDAGTIVTPKRVALDQDPHLLSAPVLAGAQGLSIASYDDPGPDGVALSHVVRVDGEHVVDMVDLKAHVLSIAEGEGARWVLTQNLTPTGGTVPDAFLKRVTEPGTPQSAQLPQNADPVGPVAAVGGAVWVPVRDGVLQYDTAGQYVRKITLPAAGRRWVAQVGKFAYASDGHQIRSLPVTGDRVDTIDYGKDVLGLASVGNVSRVLLAGSDTGTSRAAYVARADSDAPVMVSGSLPDGFVATGLAASSTRLWATGTVAGAPAIALLGNSSVAATVVLENASPGAVLAWTDAHTVRGLSGGRLYDITLP